MELLKCSNCNLDNCYIQYNNWLVCRECGQASFFEWQAAPKGIKLKLFELVKQQSEAGTTDHQVAAKINQAKTESHLWPIGEFKLTNAEEYSKYYNTYIFLKYGITSLSAASEAGAKPAPKRRKKAVAGSDANGGR